MVNQILVEKKEVKIQKLRNYLFTHCQEGIDANGLVSSEIGKKLGLDWQKAKRYLEEIERENLLHGKNYGNTRVYIPNGKKIGEKHPHKIEIGPHLSLYLDNFPGPYGKPFMRLAQKRNGQMAGSIIIPLDKISEFKDKFSNLSNQLKSLKK